MKTIATHKALFLILFWGWIANSFAVISVDSVRTNPSNCANDGIIKVYAQSPSSMLFAIVSGPDIRPAQNGNTFGALPSGTYQVMITNFSNDTAFASANIGGNYQFPDFTPKFIDPICPGSYTGSIICQAINGTGRSPYTWVLTQIATGIITTQTSDTFYNLNAGDYQIRMYDSCQAFATRFVTLSNHYNSLNASYLFHNFIACDTDVLSIVLESNTGKWSPPFVVTTYWGANVRIDTFNTPVPTGTTVLYLYDTIGGMNYGDGAGVSVTDACGNVTGRGSQSDIWDPTAAVYPILDSCQTKYRPGFVLTSSFPPNTSFHNPIYFQLWDSLSGVTIDSIVLTAGGAYYTPNYFLQPNGLYKMRVYDSCGHYTIKYFTTPVPDTTRVFVSKYSSSCLDSTATVDIHCINFGSTTTRLTILAGPTIAQSSTPRFAYRDTITYPISNFLPGTCSAYYGGDICFGVGGLPLGKYTYRAEDSCGNSRTDTFVIENQDLAVYGFDRSIIKGCPGQNKIKYQLKHTPYNYTQDFFRLYPLNSTTAIDSLMSDSAVFSNLNAGTYRISHRPNYYQLATNFISNTMQCFAINDTIVIPVYQIPRIDYATQIKCNGTVNVGLQPDSSAGVPPYSYEIISGPQTASVQASQFFTLTQPGTYVARVSDTCGFARTFSFFVDTLSFKQIVKVGASCLGSSATLISQHSPYATYVWQKPNGSFFTGDTLYICPVSAADYGVYTIKKIVSVNNCSDTFYTTYKLISSSITNLYDTICRGQSVSFGGNTYSQQGQYSDTLPTPLCDSIVILNLTVLTLYDSISQRICPGQSIIAGAKTYNAAGIYRDTFTTASGCDSIRILNLLITPVVRDSASKSVCSGQSVQVGIHNYSATGLYHDTLTSSNGCDSIYTLNLFVYPSHTGIYNISICNGDSFKVGNTYYNTSGPIVDVISLGGPCDSITIVFLKVGNYKNGFVTKSLCSGQSLQYGGNAYTAPGTYYLDTIPTLTCDSFTVLNIVSGNSKTDSVSQSICAGQSVTVGIHNYSTTGIYRDTFSVGCDSIHILNLKVGLQKQDSVSQTICSGQTVTVGIHTYNTTGIYRDTFPAALGCDSVHILNLQVNPWKRDSVSMSICSGQSITVGIHNYTSTGIYRDTFATSGCDSIHIINLKVNSLKRDTVLQSICTGQSVTVGVHTYTNSGVYRDTFVTTGCDSIHVLLLTVSNMKHDTTSLRFCEGQTVIIGNKTYTQAGLFSDTFPTSFCDSIRTYVITTYPKPFIEILADSAVEVGDTIRLNVNNPNFPIYSWLSDIKLNNTAIPNPQGKVDQDAWIVVEARDSNNCIAVDSFFLATLNDCAETIYVPNAFTPNNDTRNDKYRIFGNCIRLHKLYIFNRWGEKVWDTSDMEQGWDGYFKGSPQPPGTYVYWLSYSLLSQDAKFEKEQKGSITLIR